MGDNSESSNENTADLPFEWMIRPCELYKDEYDECTSIRGRFHQYFIHGESIDCTQWKKDFDNCNRWTENNNKKAAKELIASEKNRHQTRMAGHLLNNVWENRSEPPSDWNKPLPEWMQKEHETTYLAIKSKEIKEQPNKSPLEDRKLCVIS